MKVGVIRDVKHCLPWVPEMDDSLPAGQLVVLPSDKPDDGGDLQAAPWDTRVFFFVNAKSVEILGDL